jgi:hypothetical protein
VIKTLKHISLLLGRGKIAVKRIATAGVHSGVIEEMLDGSPKGSLLAHEHVSLIRPKNSTLSFFFVDQSFGITQMLESNYHF